MATDWEEDGPVEISRRLVGRAFSYFLPYWRRAALSLLTILLGAVGARVKNRYSNRVYLENGVVIGWKN